LSVIVAEWRRRPMLGRSQLPRSPSADALPRPRTLLGETDGTIQIRDSLSAEP